MKINSVSMNSTAFAGTVEQNEELKYSLEYARTKDLKRFEKLLNKMQSVDDEWVYSLSRTAPKIRDEDGDSVASVHVLNLTSNSNGGYSVRKLNSVKTSLFKNVANEVLYNKALKSMMDCIEEDYAIAEKNKPRNSLLKRINNLLNKN